MTRQLDSIVVFSGFAPEFFGDFCGIGAGARPARRRLRSFSHRRRVIF